MKKIYTYTKLTLIALVALTAFTSCDEDVSLAYDLDGVWGSGGTGYEIDRNIGTGRYTKNYFDWSVKGGRIYLDYDDGFRIIIRDYETYWVGGRMRFRGYFDDYDTGEQLAAFNLVKVESSSDYYDRYYQKQEAAAQTDTIGVVTTDN